MWITLKLIILFMKVSNTQSFPLATISASVSIKQHSPQLQRKRERGREGGREEGGREGGRREGGGREEGGRREGGGREKTTLVMIDAAITHLLALHQIGFRVVPRVVSAGLRLISDNKVQMSPLCSFRVPLGSSPLVPLDSSPLVGRVPLGSSPLQSGPA